MRSTHSRRALLMAAALPAVARGAARGPTIAAASDVQPAFQELAVLFRRRSGQGVTFSFGSTGLLARQIENGAPFDAFFAANEEFVTRLEQGGILVRGSRRIYARGYLAMAARREAPVQPRHLADLADPRVKRLAIANPEHAPYGLAAREALSAAGLWELLRHRVVFGENAQQATQLVRTGNADAGLLALSLCRAPELASARVDPTLYRPLRQFAALVRGGARTEGARRFLELVMSVEGQRVLGRFGFGPPPR